MKNKRVGTVSMAIVLIGFGILIFIAQINKLSAVELAMKFWPMILILLGGEVLWYSFKSKDEENAKIGYDFFSVFIVMTILAINIGIYGMLEFGLIDILKDEISTTTFNYEIPLKEYALDSSIEKIIIDGPGYSNIKIRTSEGDKITASGSINIRASREEKAEQVLEEDIINLNQSGNIMYVKVKRMGSGEAYIGDLNIIIPNDKKLEIVGGNDIDLTLENVKSNVLIDNVDGVNLRIGKNSNVKVDAIIHEENFMGNAKWNTTQIGEDGPKYKGEIIYGEGTNNINMINCYNITVDEI